jgi:N-acetylmuramate 1-kinase
MTSTHSNEPNVPNDARRLALLQFVKHHAARYGLNTDSVCVASADASFRRYFRITGKLDGQSTTFIIMDAPPAYENSQPFVELSELLGQVGLQVPKVYEKDWVQGFLLLSDLGNTTYLQALQSGADHRPLYSDAISALVKLQTGSPLTALPAYDATKLKQEMELFETWFLNKHHNIFLNEREKALLQVAIHLICNACTAQNAVWVHRDFHCRNLMVTATHNPGVLDFQDAVSGPYTYDLASLLRDAYIDWPEAAQIELAIQYWKQAQAAGIAVPTDFGEVWRDLEWMGLQRHLKVLGIFARLHHRDGKDGYLKDLPLVLSYAQRTAQRYDGLGILVRLFDRIQGIERKPGVTF